MRAVRALLLALCFGGAAAFAPSARMARPSIVMAAENKVIIFRSAFRSAHLLPHTSTLLHLASSASQPLQQIAERAATGVLATAMAFAVNSPEAFAASSKKDALGIELNTLPSISKEGLKTSVKIPGAKIPGVKIPVFSGGVADIGVKFDKKNKGPTDIGVKLPGDLKGAADGALKGDLALVVKSPAMSFNVPLLGKLSIPAINNERFDIDITTSAGRAVIEVKNDNIPALPFPGKKSSQWQAISNLGNGETYYYNTKTGATQYEYPAL